MSDCIQTSGCELEVGFVDSDSTEWPVSSNNFLRWMRVSTLYASVGSSKVSSSSSVNEDEVVGCVDGLWLRVVDDTDLCTCSG